MCFFLLSHLLQFIFIFFDLILKFSIHNEKEPISDSCRTNGKWSANFKIQFNAVEC